MGKRLRYYLTETLLWLLAGAGLIAILLVIAAYTFNTSVVMFRTGSMEPTVPAGSAALAREIPASEVEVGDILTVERPDRLPVTHRVIEIEPGNAPEERVITMQGDANDYPDASPYTITEGKVMLGSVPGAANIVNQLGNPYVLGGITIAAAILVGWAFWPRAGSPTNSTDSNGQDTASEIPLQNSSINSSRHHSWIAIVVLTAGVTGMASSAAHASQTNLVEETIASQYITLTSVFDPSSRMALTPEASSVWDIGIDVDAPSEGNGRVGLQSRGDFPLQVSVLSCSEQWTDQPTQQHNADSCAGNSRTIADNIVVSADDGLRWLDDFATSDAPWLRLLVSLPAEGVEQPVGTAGLRVDVEAVGDEVSADTEVTPEEVVPPAASTPPDQKLARTGISVLFLVLVAMVSMGLGRWLHARRAKKISGSGGDLYV
jgi:signal peptidase